MRISSITNQNYHLNLNNKANCKFHPKQNINFTSYYSYEPNPTDQEHPDTSSITGAAALLIGLGALLFALAGGETETDQTNSHDKKPRTTEPLYGFNEKGDRYTDIDGDKYIITDHGVVATFPKEGSLDEQKQGWANAMEEITDIYEELEDGSVG